jgi:ADP-ribose pyrophosphatase
MDTSRIESVLRNSERVYEGTRFSVHQQVSRATNGSRVVREMIAHPGAVTILPILEQGEIVLIRNQRYAVGTALWELPAGTIEIGEEPEETAARELEEESGYRATTLLPLTQFFTSPGISNEIMYTYIAKGLSYIGQRLDNGEEIEVEVYTWSQIDEMIKSGKICDAKTLVTLLYYRAQQQ